MLVLSRRRGERIVIGDNIVVTVISVEGGRVKLGIEAPRNIRVLRAEVDAKQAKAPAWDDEDTVVEELQLV